MELIPRRQLLQTAAGASIIGLTGCLRGLAGDQSNSTASGSVPDSPTFAFDYSDGSLTIRHTGGGSIPAGNIIIRSSTGTQVSWNELGSTAVSANGTVTSGNTATIGSTVLNWPNEVTQSETIRVVYMRGDGSPTTLATFNPSQTTTESEETTTESEHTVIKDGFEDGNTSEWTAVSELDSTFEASKERHFSGSWSVEFSEGNDEGGKPRWERVGGEVSPSKVQTAHALKKGEIYSDSYTHWCIGDTVVLRVNYNWSNNFLAVNGAGADPEDIENGAVVADLPWPSSDGFVHIVLDDIDWDANMVGEVLVNGTSKAEEVPFFNESNGIDRTRAFIAGGGGNVVFIDDTSVPKESEST